MLTYWEKIGKGKKRKEVKIEKKRRKIVKGKARREGGKLEIEVGKVVKRGEDFLFVCLFFCFSLLKTTEICFGSTKMGIFYREKAFYAGKKIRKKNYFVPSEKYACYAPVRAGHIPTKNKVAPLPQPPSQS